MQPDHEGVRPTRRCLNDLGVTPPSLAVPLHQVDHALVAKGQRSPELLAASSLARIVSLTDRVWFKVKAQRHRGAVVQLSDRDQARISEHHIDPWWIGAAGYRRDGDPDEFYAALKAEAFRLGQGQRPSTDHLLPQEWDLRRLTAELAARWRIDLELVVLRLMAVSLRCGKAATATYDRYSITVLIRAEDGNETYILVGAEGVMDPTTFAVILDSVPGIAREDWQPEPGGVAGIDPPPGAVVWSTILPPQVADNVLERVPPDGD